MGGESSKESIPINIENLEDLHHHIASDSHNFFEEQNALDNFQSMNTIQAGSSSATTFLTSETGSSHHNQTETDFLYQVARLIRQSINTTLPSNENIENNVVDDSSTIGYNDNESTTGNLSFSQCVQFAAKHKLHTISDSSNSYFNGQCEISWDGAMCWPETHIGELASLSCMEQFRGIMYNTSGLALRYCRFNATWEKSNYTNCQHLSHNHMGSDSGSLDIVTSVYFIGYSLSLLALIVAAVVFIGFKELRCLRNTIHCHLVITYILADLMWLITVITSLQTKTEKSSHVTCVTFILLHYFHLTTFFWAFVEGLYLYVLVVQTFFAETIKFRTYIVIGWIIPLAVVVTWIIVKWTTRSPQVTSEFEPIVTHTTCPWLHENIYDWIYQISALLVLAANMLFLIQIMFVLITKLRSATTPETQQSRKAAKALLVLIPLLGIMYVLLLIGPEKTETFQWFQNIRALLISTQGLLVALLYCFLNAEVRLALRHRINRVRNLGASSICCCGCQFDEQSQHLQQMREWSPRSRTESIRLYTPNTQSFRKRESSASESTTVTALVGGSINGSSGRSSFLCPTSSSGQMLTMTTRRISASPIIHTKLSTGEIGNVLV